MIDANTIIGQPIKALNNTVIIPISKVGFGFAAGGSEFNDETVNSYNKKEKEENIKYRLPFGGGSGAGVNISPVAFLIVQNDSVKLLEANHGSVLDKLVEYIPDAVDKINQIIKRKMDKDEAYFDDHEFDDDNFDENEFKDDHIEELNVDKDFNSDKDWLDEQDKFNKKPNEKKVKDEDKKNDDEEKNVVSKTMENGINQIIEGGQCKAKELEEKIKEIKKNSDE